ncbi:hypothetical protein [Bacillus amyloliquefaciens]|uniref:hypothetical protein n=1 Tax=Bacillus subtilis group TaxID=653685 RepID=UPI0005EEA0F6|nr:hypothetical protein [Bacillus amyloliquefaciens]
MKMEVENPMIKYSEVVPRFVSRCECCGELLTEQDEILFLDGDTYCEEKCLFNDLNVQRIAGSDLL